MRVGQSQEMVKTDPKPRARSYPLSPVTGVGEKGSHQAIGLVVPQLNSPKAPPGCPVGAFGLPSSTKEEGFDGTARLAGPWPNTPFDRPWPQRFPPPKKKRRTRFQRPGRANGRLEARWARKPSDAYALGDSPPGATSWAKSTASATSRKGLRLFMDSFCKRRKASVSVRP